VPVSELLLPRTSDAMTEAVLSRWLVASESQVSAGDVVAEVETDKAVVEVAAEQSGLLVAAVAEGATVEVGAVLAYVVNGSEVEEYREGRLSIGAGPSSADAPPTPTREVEQEAAESQTLDPISAIDTTAPTSGRDAFGSPLARRLARELALRVEDLFPGSGPNGRVVRADVLASVATGPKASTTRVTSAAPVALTSRQRAMAAAMVLSKTAIPHFYLFRDIDMDPLRTVRTQLSDAGLPAPSVTAFLVRALGIVLRDLPAARRVWTGDGVEQAASASVGIAVADGVDEIVVPVIREPSEMAMSQVVGELNRLSSAVRDRSLRQEDMTGAVATISNLGMLGVDALLPIIPPGQAFILGIGRSAEVLALDESGVVYSRTVATVSLSGDHRVMTGAGGAQVLEQLNGLLQHPIALVAGNVPDGPRFQGKTDNKKGNAQ